MRPRPLMATRLCACIDSCKQQAKRGLHQALGRGQAIIRISFFSFPRPFSPALANSRNFTYRVSASSGRAALQRPAAGGRKSASPPSPPQPPPPPANSRAVSVGRSPQTSAPQSAVSRRPPSQLSPRSLLCAAKAPAASDQSRRAVAASRKQLESQLSVAARVVPLAASLPPAQGTLLGALLKLHVWRDHPVADLCSLRLCAWA